MNPYKSRRNNENKIIPIGVLVHETLHNFGLPDLYDTDYSSKGSGYLSIMASGSWGTNSQTPLLPAFANAWTRNKLNNYLIANNRESIDINIINITETTKNLELSPITKNK